MPQEQHWKCFFNISGCPLFKVIYYFVSSPTLSACAFFHIHNFLRHLCSNYCYCHWGYYTHFRWLFIPTLPSPCGNILLWTFASINASVAANSYTQHNCPQSFTSTSWSFFNTPAPSGPTSRHFTYAFHILFFVYLSIIRFNFFFIQNYIFLVIWTNTVRTEVAKNAKRAKWIAFLFICYFVVPSAAVGRYEKQRLSDKIEPTKPTVITNIDTPVY